MIFLSVTTLILGSAPPCGALDLDEVLALALERGDEVATQQAELAAAHADEALARTLRILPSATAMLVTHRGDAGCPDRPRPRRDREEQIRAERRARVTMGVCAPVLLHARGPVR